MRARFAIRSQSTWKRSMAFPPLKSMAFPPLNLGLAGKRADGLQLAELPLPGLDCISTRDDKLSGLSETERATAAFCDSKPIYLEAVDGVSSFEFGFGRETGGWVAAGAAYAFRLGAHFNVSGNVRKFFDSKPIFLDWLMVSPSGFLFSRSTADGLHPGSLYPLGHRLRT